MDIKVLVHGVSGRMGRQVLSAVSTDPGMTVVGAVHRTAETKVMINQGDFDSVPLASNLEDVLNVCESDVVVDFTNRDACLGAAELSLKRGIHFVTGTTGLAQAELDDLDSWAHKSNVGVIVAPNFAFGAVILTSLLRKIAPLFDYADIIESHHEGKIDAPSGTALAMARALSELREFNRHNPEIQTVAGTRGGDYRGVGIHSLRQLGRSAHHEVVLGALGQTLTLRHDTIGRECYMPGILMAVREVVNLKGLVLGLDTILGV